VELLSGRTLVWWSFCLVELVSGRTESLVELLSGRTESLVELLSGRTESLVELLSGRTKVRWNFCLVEL